MLIEIEQMVDLDQINPVEIIGEPWAVFGDCIPKEQYNVLSRVLKLLFAISDSMTEIVPLIIQTLVNDDLDIQSKKLEIYLTLNNVLIEQLNEMGIQLHEEKSGYDNLHINLLFLEMLLDVGSIEDTYGLANSLLDESIDQPDRLMDIMAVFNTEDVTSELETHLLEVDERLLQTIAGVLKNDDTLLEGVSDSTIKRVKENMVYMDGTLGRQIVTSGSALEANINTLKSYFVSELEQLSQDTTDEGIKKYVYNLVSLYLVSSTNTASILTALTKDLTGLSEDILQAMKIESHLQHLVLDV